MTLASLTRGSATDKLASATAQAQGRQVIDVGVFHSYVRYNPAITGFNSDSMNGGSGLAAVNFNNCLSGGAGLRGLGIYSPPGGGGWKDVFLFTRGRVKAPQLNLCKRGHPPPLFERAL